MQDRKPGQAEEDGQEGQGVERERGGGNELRHCGYDRSAEQIVKDSSYAPLPMWMRREKTGPRQEVGSSGRTEDCYGNYPVGQFCR